MEGIRIEPVERREEAEELQVADGLVVRAVGAKRHLRVLAHPLGQPDEVPIREQAVELHDPATRRRRTEHVVGQGRCDLAEIGGRRWIAEDESALDALGRVGASPMGVEDGRDRDSVRLQRAHPEDRATAVCDRSNMCRADRQHASARDRLARRRRLSGPVKDGTDEEDPRSVGAVAIDAQDAAAPEPAVGQRDRPELSGRKVGVRLRDEGVDGRHSRSLARRGTLCCADAGPPPRRRRRIP